MNSSKSMAWLRQPQDLQDKTSYYNNQQSKHSTQNIHSLLKIDEAAHSVERLASAPKTQHCCKDGHMLKSSEETGNCSFCG